MRTVALSSSSMFASDPSPRALTETSNSAELARLESMTGEAFAELDNYEKFLRGWDGCDGEPFKTEIVAIAKDITSWVALSFAALRETPTEITPGPASDGSIDIEFAFAGRVAIINIESNRTAVVYGSDGTRSFEYEVQRIDERVVVGLCHWLIYSSRVPIVVDKN